MANEKTFTQWFADFHTAFYQGAFPEQRYGQAFTNALYAAGKVTQANALVNFINDPWEKDYVPQEVLDFVERNWSWPQG